MNRAATTAALAALLAMPTARAHGGGVGVPGWAVLIASVLGLWCVIGGSVVVADRLLRRVLGDR
jgi:hypothetical protein